jgi:hypothetical protein
VVDLVDQQVVQLIAVVLVGAADEMVVAQLQLVHQEQVAKVIPVVLLLLALIAVVQVEVVKALVALLVEEEPKLLSLAAQAEQAQCG